MERSGTIGLFALAAILMPAFEAIEPWTDAEETSTGPAVPCNARGGSAGGSCHWAMLQKKVSGPSRFAEPSQNHVDAFVDASESAVTGAIASLDNKGYSRVLSLKSRSELGAFLRRILQDLDFKIMSEEQFRNFAAWVSLDGEQQDRLHDYKALVNDFQELALRPCTWVIDPNKKALEDGSSAPLNEDGYRIVAGLRSNQEMRRFIGRIIKDEGFYLVDPGGLDGVVPFHSCEKEIQSLDRLQNEMRGVASTSHGWVSRTPPKKKVNQSREIISTLSVVGASGKRKAQPGAVSNQSAGASVGGIPNGIGTSAELTEEGYYEVAIAKSNIEMSVFILRVVKEMGMQVIHEDQFIGLVPYYSGELGFQTLDILKNELKKVSKDLCAWVVPEEGESAASETSGKTAPMNEGGYTAVANMHSPMDMRDFLQRVLKDMHMLVLNKGGLMGFLPFHDCEHGAKSLKAMRSEVYDAAQKKAWVRPMEQHEIKAMEQAEVSVGEKEDKESKGHQSGADNAQASSWEVASKKRSEADSSKAKEKEGKERKGHESGVDEAHASSWEVASKKHEGADSSKSAKEKEGNERKGVDEAHASSWEVASKKRDEADSSKSVAGKGVNAEEEGDQSSSNVEGIATRAHDKSHVSKKDDSLGDDRTAAAPVNEDVSTEESHDTALKKIDDRPPSKSENAEPLEGHAVDYLKSRDGAPRRDREEAPSNETDHHTLDLMKVKNHHHADMLTTRKGGDSNTRKGGGDGSSDAATPKEHEKVSSKGKDDRAVEPSKVKKLENADALDGHKVDKRFNDGDADALENDEENAPKQTDDHPIDLLKVKKVQNPNLLNKHTADDANTEDKSTPDDHKTPSSKRAEGDALKKRKIADPPAGAKVQMQIGEESAKLDKKRESKRNRPAVKAKVDEQTQEKSSEKTPGGSAQRKRNPNAGLSTLASERYRQMVEEAERHMPVAAPKKGERKHQQVKQRKAH